MTGGRGSASRNSCEGMSLLELMMVFSCTVVLLAIAVPNFNKLLQEWTLWGAAHTLETSLRWGRLQAITANSAMMFVVAEEGKSYYWADPESGARFERTVTCIPARVRLTGFPRRPLRFYPRGNAAPAGTYTLEGEAGTYRVVVSFVGRIRIQRD